MEKENISYNKTISADDNYAFGKQEKSPVTDWGQGTRYYTCDGRQVATFEQVMKYNEMYYQALKVKEPQIEEDYQMRR